MNPGGYSLKDHEYRQTVELCLEAKILLKILYGFLQKFCPGFPLNYFRGFFTWTSCWYLDMYWVMWLDFGFFEGFSLQFFGNFIQKFSWDFPRILKIPELFSFVIILKSASGILLGFHKRTTDETSAWNLSRNSYRDSFEEIHTNLFSIFLEKFFPESIPDSLRNSSLCFNQRFFLLFILVILVGLLPEIYIQNMSTSFPSSAISDRTLPGIPPRIFSGILPGASFAILVKTLPKILLHFRYGTPSGISSWNLLWFLTEFTSRDFSKKILVKLILIPV